MLKRLSATFNANNPDGHPGSSSLSLPDPSYPRPSSLSTPTGDGGPQYHGYFQQHSNAGSRNGSPLPSPSGTVASRSGGAPTATIRSVSGPPSPYFPSSSTSAGVAQTYQGALAGPSSQQPIDRSVLQKSLKTLETLLVALDEYRDLNSRLAKVEKRLGKASKEFAASMTGYATVEKDKHAVQNVPPSILQALNTTASLFETLSETNSKSSKAIQKEYDGINDICGKFFKKVAKEERAHDDALEALDNKLKKANFAYDKRVRSHPSNAAAAASGAHEQFVPLLSSLTEEMSRTKIQHGRKLAGRREEAAREVARAVSALAEMEWKRACENVKRVGLEVGALVGVRCLLGDGMPPDWPEDVTDTKAGLGAQDDVRRSAVHAEAMVGREDLMPPRPHYSMDNRRPSDASSTSSGIRQPVLGASTHQPGTAASPRMYATQLQPISYESPYRSPPQPAPGKPAHTDDSSARPAPQPRRTSYPEQRGERDWSGEATVLARPARQTPSLEQTFASFPHPHSSHAPTSRNVSGGSTSSSAPAPATTSADSSPVRSRPSHESYNSSGSLVSLRESATVQRMPNVEAGLHHVVSHRVAGYGAAYEGDEKQQREDGGSKVTMPDGFVMEETGDYSPEKPKRAGASQNWDRRRTSENSDSSSSNDARQASQSIAAALERSVEAGNRLSRSMSVESNASEKSFVARMKLKYAQEREEASAKQELSASGAGLQNQRRADPTSPPLGGASARVSSMAQRFEQRPPAGATSHAGSSSSVSSSFAGPSRPAHAHRQSLPVLPTSGRYTSPPPTSSYTHSSMTEPLSTLSRLAEQHEARRYSNEERVAGLAGNSEEEQHPDVCACESCTARSYGTFETLGSRVNDRDSARQIRRVSMPVIGGVPQ